MVVEEHQFKIEEPGLNGVEEHDPLENTPAPSDNSSQPQSHENSPYPDRKRQVREWHDGYKPSKKRKKSPRPGESTFRVPMSMEQRKSLGASVRPKEPQGLGIFNSLPVDAEITLLLDQGGNPIVPAMRGGMKLEFRAYGLPPPSTNSQRGNPIKLSPNDIIGQEQQTNHFYQYPLLNESSHNANLSEVSLEDGPKLAWWLAQQISQSSLQQSYGHMGSQVAEIPAQQFYGNETPSQSRKRQTDRERKARWREANTQRSEFIKVA